MSSTRPLVIDLDPAPDTWVALSEHLAQRGHQHAVVLRHVGGPLGSPPQSKQTLEAQQRCIEALSSPSLLSVLQVRHGADEAVLALALSCTLRLASPDTSISAPYWGQGRLPLRGSTQRLGPKARRAVVRICLGDVLDADQLQANGLVDLVVDEASMDTTALHWAARAQDTDRRLVAETLSLLAGPTAPRSAAEADALERWLADAADGKD